MNITINNHTYELKEEAKAFAGGEARIFLMEEQCLKYFFDKVLRNPSKQKKVLLLCDKYQELSGKDGFQHIGIPKYPAFNHDTFIGYTMDFFKNSGTITEFQYRLLKNQYSKNSFDDKTALSVIKQLFKSLQLVHNHKIILGDINPENILINNSTFQSFIVDVDSAHIGNYPCIAGLKHYRCPVVDQMGENSDNSWSYSMSSDIYSLSFICFELFVGINPFTPPVDPIIDLGQAKREDISYLSFHHKKTTKHKVYHLENKMLYKKVFERLDHLKKNYPDLYQHFLNVFFYKKRTYYGHQVSKKQVHKKRHTHKALGVRPVRGYTPVREKSDPLEFGLFLKQYKINLNTIQQ